MTVLLDTHTFLWFIAGDSKLSATARTLIESPSNEVLLSIVSLWEIVVKTSVGKLPLQRPIEDLIRLDVDGNGLRILPTTTAHVIALAALPLHHRDPFDRLLVAQAIVEQVPLLGADSTLDRYNVQRLW